MSDTDTVFFAPLCFYKLITEQNWPWIGGRKNKK